MPQHYYTVQVRLDMPGGTRVLQFGHTETGPHDGGQINVVPEESFLWLEDMKYGADYRYLLSYYHEPDSVHAWLASKSEETKKDTDSAVVFMRSPPAAP